MSFPPQQEYYVSQKALDVYNTLFCGNRQLSGDAEGYLHVKMPTYTISIHSSGDVIGIFPNDPMSPGISYPSDHFDKARLFISSNN